MIKGRGLAFKLTLILSGSVVLVFALVFGFFYRFTRNALWRDIESNARGLAESTAHRIDAVLRSVQEVPEGLAEFIEEGESGRKATLRILKSLVDNNPAIYGCAIAWEPFSVEKSARHFAPYYYEVGGRMHFKMLGGADYDYFKMDWYRIPKETGRPAWTEPYFDEGGGGVPMATYAVPFYRQEGGRRVFAGVATADVSLDWLSQTVGAVRILETGDAFLISRKGTFVAHRLKRLVMKETLFGQAESRNYPALKTIAERMVRGETGFVSYIRVTTGLPSHMYFTPIPSTGWSLAVVFPDEELLSDMGRLGWTVAFLGLLGLFVLVGVVALESRSITGPLSAMAAAAGQFAEGDLDAELPPARGQDEVGRLTEAFRRMKDSLKDYIRRLTETTAAKQRIESELSIAREIQMSTLPKIFPPLPDLPELAMYAMIEPAREVGGDLYDFYPAGPRRFCFTVGDVSGKGVPASLFMAVSKTLLKAAAEGQSPPEEVLRRVNDALSDNNEKAMFITVFFAALDLGTGELEYANGGHNPPLLLRRDGSVETLDEGLGPVVGALRGMRYGRGRTRLVPGDRLLLYTDGVTEATAPEGSMFGEERLFAALRSWGGRAPKELSLELMAQVRSFSAGELADDVTLMAIEFLGRRPV